MLILSAPTALDCTVTSLCAVPLCESLLVTSDREGTEGLSGAILTLEAPSGQGGAFH